MGQTASLTAISASRFHQIVANPSSYDAGADGLDDEGFVKTFKGLSYVLAKGRDHEIAELAEQIFEPAKFLGEDFEYNEVDWESDGDHYMTLLEERIYYHSPATVKAIADLLAGVTDKEFAEAFNPDDMNRELVYPSGAWNHDNKANEAYNEWHTVEEFHRLKQFFARINNGDNYCVCYIG